MSLSTTINLSKLGTNIHVLHKLKASSEKKKLAESILDILYSTGGVECDAKTRCSIVTRSLLHAKEHYRCSDNEMERKIYVAGDGIADIVKILERFPHQLQQK